MLNLTSTQLTALNADSIGVIHIVKLTYQEVKDGPDKFLYYTDYCEDVFYDGNVYLKVPIKFGGLTQSEDGSINDVQLSIGNYDDDRIIQTIIENNIIIGKNATITEFVLIGASLSPAILSNTFRIKSAAASSGQIEFTLSIGFDYFSKSVPNRKAWGKFCRWKVFKGEECKYAGPDETCEKTFVACRKKQNTLNFGGFPAIVQQRFFF